MSDSTNADAGQMPDVAQILERMTAEIGERPRVMELLAG